MHEKARGQMLIAGRSDEMMTPQTIPIYLKEGRDNCVLLRACTTTGDRRYRDVVSLSQAKR